MFKRVLLVGVIILFAVGLWLYFGSRQSPGPAAGGNTAPTATPPSSANAPTQPPGSAPSSSAPTVAANATIIYTDSGFSPSVLTVKKGTTVTFVNNASDGVWPASNPHPLHNSYPTTGGCIGSTFDACHQIAPGGSWQFTFNIVGSWGYHNHLNPSEDGTVVVQ